MTVAAVTWSLWGAFLAGGIIGMLITFVWVGVASFAADTETDTPVRGISITDGDGVGSEPPPPLPPAPHTPTPSPSSPDDDGHVDILGDWGSPLDFLDEFETRRRHPSSGGDQ